MPYRPFAPIVLYIAKKAGEVLMYYYRQDHIEVKTKEDGSPVTKADQAADMFIRLALEKYALGIPVVSEEDASSHTMDVRCEKFWLVDPLDGTKSFIRKKGEFTVNIALIENGRPVGGVVYTPILDAACFTAEDGKAYRQVRGGLPDEICVRATPATGAVVVASRSHPDAGTQQFIDTLPSLDICLPVASSLKFCMIAEGKADFYPRFSPTMEWDTAAGHAVVLAAGGSVTTPHNGKALAYGKQGFLNGDFLARGALS